MPIMNGPQTAIQLRKLGYQHLIIGVTGNALDIDILEFEQAGRYLLLIYTIIYNILCTHLY